MATSKVWNWGILGCGKISWDFGMCLAHHSRSRMVACAARSKAAAAAFGAEFAIPANYDSYAHLVSDPNVDVVYVGTIHPNHKANVLRALDSGKHVVVEKPAGVNLKETEQMISAAQTNGRLLLEAVWTRFFPATRRVKQLIASGELGKLVSFTGNFGAKMPTATAAPRLWQRETAGGALLDIGIYAVQSLPFAFGSDRIPEMQAMGCVSDEGIDTMAAANFRYSQREFAQIHCNMFATTSNRYRFAFEEGIVTVHTHHPTEVQITRLDPLKTIMEASVSVEPFPLPKGLDSNGRVFNYTNSEGLFYEIEAVVDALDNGKLQCDEYTFGDMRVVHSVMDEMRRQIGVHYPQDFDD